MRGTVETIPYKAEPDFKVQLIGEDVFKYKIKIIFNNGIEWNMGYVDAQFLKEENKKFWKIKSHTYNNLSLRIINPNENHDFPILFTDNDDRIRYAGIKPSEVKYKYLSEKTEGPVEVKTKTCVISPLSQIISTSDFEETKKNLVLFIQEMLTVFQRLYEKGFIEDDAFLIDDDKIQHKLKFLIDLIKNS